MKLAKVKELLKCRVLSKNFKPDLDIECAYASDLMSDVLVFPKPGALLITGLTNHQAIRTGKVANTCAIVFVRNKNPDAGTIKLGEQYQIPLLATGFSMFESCGILFSNGLKGICSKK